MLEMGKMGRKTQWHLEVEKVGGMCQHEGGSESIWRRREMREMSGSSSFLGPEQGCPFPSPGVQEPAAVHEEQGPHR